MRVRPRILLGVLLLIVAIAGSFDANAQYRRKDISTFSALEQLELRQLIMQWITTSAYNPVQRHLSVVGPLPIGVHCNTERFASWHREYLDALEAWLMSQPNGSRYVPLPKWNPTTGIPPAFFNNQVFPGNAVVGGNWLVDQTPNDRGTYNIARFLNPNTICNYFAGNEWRTCMSGGTSNTWGTATDNFARDLELEHNSVHGAIGGVMNSAASPRAAIFWLWHAFVDDLYQHYLCRCTDTQRKYDLYIKDNYSDIGDEANTTTTIYYASPEIWVRNYPDPFNALTGRYANEDNPTRHQPPLYKGAADPNYVYVRIRNRGCTTMTGTHRVVVYWSVASSGLNWASDWTIFPRGQQISMVLVPGIAPGESWTAQIPWVVPPQDIGREFCLLARLESTSDPMAVPEGLNVNTNARNNNNIAMRNVITIPEDPISDPPNGGGNGTYCSYVRPVYEYGGYTRVGFEYPEYSQDYLEPVVYLGPELYEIWAAGGYQGYGVEPYDQQEYSVRLAEPTSYIDNLYLPYDPPGDSYGYDLCVDVYTNYDPNGGYPPVYYGDDSYIAVTQYEQNEGGEYEVTGGEYYEIRYQRDEYSSGCGDYLETVEVQPAGCPYSSNGSIDLTPTGEGPFTYYWSNGANTEDLYNVRPGTYQVMVRNGVGCTDSRTIEVPYNSTLETYITGQSPNCANENGYAHVEVSGGHPPYTYQWYRNDLPIPGATSPDLGGMGYSRYSVVVTDGSGCSIRDEVEYVDDWMELSVTAQITDASSPTTNDGSVNITVHNGMPPYEFVWSNASTAEDLGGVHAGQYTVQITDMMGCIYHATFTVGVVPANKNALTPENSDGNLSIQGVVPNPANDLAEVQYTLRTPSSIRVEIYDDLGKLVQSHDQGVKPAGQSSVWLPVSTLPAGRYSCRLVFQGGITAVPFLVVR